MLHRVIAFLMMLLLAAAGAAQYNDPDWELWMPLYGAGALGSLAFLLGRPWLLALGMGLVCMAWAVVSGLEVAEKHMNLLADEEGREFLGLVLLGAWMIALYVHDHRKPRPPRRS